MSDNWLDEIEALHNRLCDSGLELYGPNSVSYHLALLQREEARRLIARVRELEGAAKQREARLDAAEQVCAEAFGYVYGAGVGTSLGLWTAATVVTALTRWREMVDAHDAKEE